MIAQTPIEPRDASRLMVVDRASGAITHRHFRDLAGYLHRGDILVTNDSRVIPARLFARKTTGGKVEILLLRPLDDRRWEVLVGGKRVRVDTRLVVEKEGIQVSARVVEELSQAGRVLEFLKEHDKVVVTMRLKGRQRAHGDLALERMAEFASRFEDVATIERSPERSSVGQLTMLLKPR